MLKRNFSPITFFCEWIHLPRPAASDTRSWPTDLGQVRSFLWQPPLRACFTVAWARTPPKSARASTTTPSILPSAAGGNSMSRSRSITFVRSHTVSNRATSSHCHALIGNLDKIPDIAHAAEWLVVEDVSRSRRQLREHRKRLAVTGQRGRRR